LKYNRFQGRTIGTCRIVGQSYFGFNQTADDFMRAAALALMLLLAARASSDDAAGVKIGNPQIERWRFGVSITAQTAPALAVVAAAPVPVDWPEQKVRIIQEDVSPAVRRVRFRSVGEGARQMVVEIPRLAAGETAQAILTFEIEKSEIESPANSALWKKPEKPSRELRTYLAPSPKIESSDREIHSLAARLIEGKPSGWDSAAAIYDWVRENVQYVEGDLKGALAALRDREGDCEELTSLFIALCRASGIPARTVWVPGHCYPEFYLEDAHGTGHWLPCQAAGDRQFGQMRETRPILQKGDSFRLPEERQPVRYAHPILQSNPRAGYAHPAIAVIQDRVEL
jgi:hypothetical protein